MHVPPAIRPEYFDAALEKTTQEAERAALQSLKALVDAFNGASARIEAQCIANRIADREKPRRVGAPASVMSGSLRAAEDIHKLELRKCRRALTASEIVRSMLQRLNVEIELWQSLLPKVKLLPNRALEEELLRRRIALRDSFTEFLEAWENAV